MATVLAFGEQIQVFIALGYPANGFQLDSSVLDGTNVLDGDLNGDDVAEYVQELTISRGRSDQFQPFRAGTCTIVLNNDDRQFDPTNEVGVYWNPLTNESGVQPRRRVQVVSENNLPLFTGRIANIELEYDFVTSRAIITAVDDMVLLANATVGDAFTPPSELSGARVSSILNLPEVAYPATRDIAVGVATLGNYQVDENTNVAAYLAKVAQAEAGFFFVANNGDLTFTDRTEGQFSVPVASFADDGSATKYQGLEMSFGQLFYNRVQATRETGAVQVAEDLASQTTYGISTLSLDGLLVASDGDATAIADTLLKQFANPQFHFDNLQLIISVLSGATRNTINGLELGQIIEITRTFAVGSPLSITKDYGIERISHVITPDRHIVTLGLFDAFIVSALILDDAVFGEIDAFNALA